MNDRFKPIKRTAIDGKVWWVVWDNMRREYSTYRCHGRYKTKKEALIDIKYYNEAWGFRMEK